MSNYYRELDEDEMQEYNIKDSIDYLTSNNYIVIKINTLKERMDIEALLDKFYPILTERDKNVFK